MKNILKFYLIAAAYLGMNYACAQNNQGINIGTLPGFCYGQSGSCENNVNNGSTLSASEDDNIRAVFSWGQYNDPSYLNNPFCTGTLVNQDIHQDGLGNYAFIANHCLDGQDLSKPFVFYFNYQSKDGNDADIPLLARTQPRYPLVSNIQVIGTWVDFTLIKILAPIPPHYNVYYAGWKTNELGGFLFNFPFYQIHHPAGDIKKASVLGPFFFSPNMIAEGCTLITTIIDDILGFFGIKTVTEVICNYVEVPWFVIPFYTSGYVEGGSSGSSVFNNNTRSVGVLSGALGSCSVPIAVSIAKFKLAYNMASVRFALNPNNNLGTNDIGLSGRQITCYHSLENLSGDYYPAGDYQPNNNITLASATDITNSPTAPLTVYPGANFTFQAPVVTFSPGTFFNNGSVVEVQGVSCSANFREGGDGDQGPTYQSVGKQATQLTYMTFDAQKYLSKNDSVQNNSALTVYPNPSPGNFNVVFKQDNNFKEVVVSDVLGRVVYQNNALTGNWITIDLTTSPSGVYILKSIDDKGNVYTNKLVRN
jgi:hypothetical protein